MRDAGYSPTDPQHDAWLERRCLIVEAAGRHLASAVGQANERLAQSNQTTRKKAITEAQLRQVESACKILHDLQVEVQNALFDCEHELRELRERDVSPAELLIDGERLIGRYRFLRRRARILDGLLAYLPMVSSHASACLEALRMVKRGGRMDSNITVPDCAFALVALDQLREEEVRPS
jgi:hypothetical protein